MKKFILFLLAVGSAIAQPSVNGPTAGVFNNPVPSSGGSTPSFGAEIVRNSVASGSTTFTIPIGALAAGKALVVSIITSASSATVNNVVDPRGNTYTVQQTDTAVCGSGMSAAIVTSIISTPLQAGDVLTVTLNSTSGTRLYQAMYVNNATAIDITKKASSCNSTTVNASATVAANSVQLGFVENVGGTTPTYAGGSWSAVGANQSSGAVGIVSYIQTSNAGGGTANPNGSFASNVQWECMWVSVK